MRGSEHGFEAELLLGKCAFLQPQHLDFGR
jgi:hypothetical protein